MLPFADTPWDSDIDAAICRAGASPDRDRSFIAQTADLIESGIDPDTGGALSLTALAAWEERATTRPQEDPHHAVGHPPSRIAYPHRDVSKPPA